MKHLCNPATRNATLLLWIALGSLLTAAEKKDQVKALNTIDRKQLQKHVDVLADDTFEGRAAGSRGGQAAAGYLVEQLQKIGLAGGALEEKYYQPFSDGSRNILAIIPGSDNRLKNEIIMVGAHYDHVGYGKRSNSYGPLGYIHNGADDNASGVAGLLELGEALKQLPQSPRRTILLAFWDDEEQGMLGSKHWVTDPTSDLKQIKFMINVDMIGRLRENRMEIIGTRTASGLRHWISERNQRSNLELLFKWNLKADSDHHTFFKQNIPVLMLHTGLHDNYHRPSDDSNTINAAGLEQVSRFLFELTTDLANRDEVPVFREESRKESKKDRKLLETPVETPPPRLGVSWIDHDPNSGAIILSRVRDESPADTAGLQEQDRLLKFNNNKIRDDAHFREMVSQASRQTSVTVARPGQEKPLVLSITFPAQPFQLGMLWRTDPAEPLSVTVIQVVAGSAAAQAGLKAGDRLLQLGDHVVQGNKGLETFIQSMPAKVTARIERAGQTKQLSIQLPPRPQDAGTN